MRFPWTTLIYRTYKLNQEKQLTSSIDCVTLFLSIDEGEDDGRNIRVNVGSGFSDDDRSQYWTERTQLLGQLVEVEADVVTQNQDGTYSLRFPRFLRFRSFEVGQKI